MRLLLALMTAGASIAASCKYSGCRLRSSKILQSRQVAPRAAMDRQVSRGKDVGRGQKYPQLFGGSNFWTLVQVTVDAKLLGRSGSAPCGKLESKKLAAMVCTGWCPCFGRVPVSCGAWKNYCAGYAHPKPLICIQRHGWTTSVEWALALDSHIRRTEHSMSNESTCIEICLSASHLATMTLVMMAKINKK